MNLEKLVKMSGGEVVDGLVTRPGVMVLSESKPTPEAQALFSEANIGPSEEYLQQGEFLARLTYMSFPDSAEPEGEYMRKMVEEHGHLSMFSAWTVTFLLAGVSAEATLELVAHKEASVSRLTTSRTKAQDAPLYVSPKIPEIREALSQLSSQVDQVPVPRGLDNKEGRNQLAPGYKATALSYTMSLKDYHKLFIGRLSMRGVEVEVRELCEGMCQMLHDRFPLLIKTPEEYYLKNNDAKLFV